jgi:sugar phosphate isomerase/epimerase
VEQVIKGSALLGAPSARVRLPRYGGRINYRQLRDQARGQFREVEQMARLHGVRAVIETHQGTLTPSATGLASFLDDFDPLLTGALWDPGNMVLEGFEQPGVGGGVGATGSRRGGCGRCVPGTGSGGL